MKPDVSKIKQLHESQTALVASLLEFSALLDRELKLLSTREADALKDLNQEKIRQLEAIHHLHQTHHANLTSLDVQPSKSSEVANFIASLPEVIRAKLGPSHTELLEALRLVEGKNARNQQAAARTQRNVSQLLSVLQGQQNKDRVYNTTGAAGHYRAQSRLGKA